MPAKQRLERICKVEKKCSPGAAGLVAKIDHKVQVTRFRPKRPGDGRAKNLQTFNVKPPAKLG